MPFEATRSRTSPTRLPGTPACTIPHTSSARRAADRRGHGVSSVPLHGEHGEPGSLVGAVSAVDRKGLVSATFTVHGDPLPILAPLNAGRTEVLESPRALVWGLDLAATASRRNAHKRLRSECQTVMSVAFEQPTLAHLFVVYTHGSALPLGSCLTAAGQAAAKLHAELERARGRFEEVVLIDATGWENGEVLRDRIVHSVATPAGVAGDIALDWHSIAHASIHEAAMAQLC